MFTGIIKWKGKLENIKKTESDLSFWIDLSMIQDIKIGDSIAINGTCLTIAKLENNKAFFELMHETLNKTNFKHAFEGEEVNLEDSLKIGGKLDGHIVYGDVDSIGVIKNIKSIGNSKTFTIEFPEEFGKYIIDKGRITLDGASLTVNDSTNNTFNVSLIPHSLKVLNISNKQIGDQVNLEYDVYAKMVYKQSRGNNE